MESKEEVFHPESVNEQVEQLMLIKHPLQRVTVPGAHTIAELQSIYQEHISLLENAWARIATHVATQYSSGEPIRIDHYQEYKQMQKQTLPSGVLSSEAVSHSQKPSRPPHPRKRLRRIIELGLLAAVVLGMLFGWGEISHLFHQAHLQTTSPANHQHQTTKESLYVVWREGIYKLDEQSGALLWKSLPDGWSPTASLNPNPAPSLPDQSFRTHIEVTTDDTVYVTRVASSAKGASSNLYALNAQTGVVDWEYTLAGGEIIGNVVKSGQTLYAQVQIGATSEMLALNAQNGHLIWRTPLKGLALASIGDPQTFLVKNDLIYISIGAGPGGTGQARPVDGLEALHAQDGTLAWWQPTGDNTWSPPPVASGTLVYFLASWFDPKNDLDTFTSLKAFDAQTGQLRWSSTPLFNANTRNMAPVLDNGRIYFGVAFGPENEITGKVFALDATSGKPLQEYDLPVGPFGILVSNRRLYVPYYSHGNSSNPQIYETYGSEGILAVDVITHQQIWLNTDAGSASAQQYGRGDPTGLLLGKSLYFVTTNGLTEAINPATGKTLWQKELPGQTTLPTA